MRNKLSLPEVEAAFFRAVARSGGNVSHAARQVGLTANHVNTRRRRDPAFKARLVGLLPGGKPVRVMQMWDEATKAAFLDALAETGSAASAGLQVGVSDASAFSLRRRDGEFAHQWALALNAAALKVEDRLFEGALGGFTTRTVADDGTTTTIYRERPDIMLKLLFRRDTTAKSPHRLVELSPQNFEEAQIKIERHIRLATAARIAEMRASGELLAGPLAEGEATP